VLLEKADEQGQTADHLYFPRGIYVHRLDNALYTADAMNNRIQKWNNNSQEGITVAGSKDGVSGYDASKLASPLYVWVDEKLLIDNQTCRDPINHSHSLFKK